MRMFLHAWRPLAKTKYRRHVDDAFEPTYTPSTKCPCSFLRWFEKLGRPRPNPLTLGDFEFQSHLLSAEFSRFVRSGVTPIEEVLLRVDWSKSPGYPWDLYADNNRDAFTRFGPLILMCVRYRLENKPIEFADAKEWLDLNFTPITTLCVAMLNGDPLPTFGRASQKDEILINGKYSRIFVPMPLDHRIACACLMQRQCDDLIDTHLQHASVVGMALPGNGLTLALAKLAKFKYGFHADHTGMDTGCANPDAPAGFFVEKLPVAYRQPCKDLWSDAVHGEVIVDGVVYMVSFNPSGWYLTTFWNTFKAVDGLIRGAVHLVKKNPPPELGDPTQITLRMVRAHIELCVGGDDIAFSTDLECFNVIDYAAWAATQGLYLETPDLEAQSPLELVLYSHRGMPFWSTILQRWIRVPAGRIGKYISALDFYTTKGDLANAQRYVALAWNIYPYQAAFDAVWPLIHYRVMALWDHAGRPEDSEWQGLFSSFPNEAAFLRLIQVTRSG